MEQLSVREIQPADIEPLVDYWLTATPEYLAGMGADITKLPTRPEWQAMLSAQIEQPYEQKKSYCIIWLLDGAPVGHSNINKITFGELAYMHLHLWKSDGRRRGLGTEFVQRTLPFFFENFQLKQLFCEPYALNTAPNKTLEKLGFQFVESYTSIPGTINFEQLVNLWSLSREAYERSFLPA